MVKIQGSPERARSNLPRPRKIYPADARRQIGKTTRLTPLSSRRLPAAPRPRSLEAEKGGFEPPTCITPGPLVACPPVFSGSATSDRGRSGNAVLLTAIHWRTSRQRHPPVGAACARAARAWLGRLGWGHTSSLTMLANHH